VAFVPAIADCFEKLDVAVYAAAVLGRALFVWSGEMMSASSPSGATAAVESVFKKASREP
jgi:hypothetical protein